MWKQRFKNINSVSELISKRTGMTQQELENDTRVFEYPNLDAAAKLLLNHIELGSTIRVYGDYDADGITSLFILKTLFELLDYSNVDFVAPRRFTDGYGINVARVKEFYDAGCELLITIDNGIAAIDAIALARKLGMDVLILDHHEAFRNENSEVVLPNATVIVDPHVTGGYDIDNPSHKFEDLCGAGIGLRFFQYVTSYWSLDRLELYEQSLEEAIIAAGIGTVADLVELVDDNRQIVKKALELINQGCGTEGLKCLLEALKSSHITSTDIAFGIAPCLNASGRLYDTGADMMVQLLSYRKSDEELKRMVVEAKKTNEDRKRMTSEAVLRAEKLMMEVGADKVIVIVDETLSPGIAGLVASKLTETYYRPSIVLTKNAMGICKGSGRSVPGIDLKELLDLTQEYLLGYGGHPAAAGVSLKAENVDAFREAICKIAPVISAPEDQYYDIECSADKDALWSLLTEIEKYEPYGQGNSPIKVMISGVELGDSAGNTHRIIGHEKSHIKFITKTGIDFVWFSGAAKYINLGSPKKIDVLGSIGVNEFNGNRTIQVLIDSIRKSQ